jgi:succinate-semialdehyde dehydrogenase/glutarate-semialdehyde dehydrogenase
MTDWGWATPGHLAALAEDVSASGTAAPITAPATGAVLGEVHICTPTDVTAAIERARDAQVAWADRPISERVGVFASLHDRVLERASDLADVVQAETGKARRDAIEEVLDVAMNARYYANRARDLLSPHRRRGALPLLTKTIERRQPHGVVGLITPWNYPLTLGVSDAIPALLAGNTVVLKPDESTPYSALVGARLLRQAGLPPGAFQVCPGDGETLGDPLIEGCDFVGFTGSTAVGRSVAERAGRQLTPCSLELGGNNPIVVLDDVDPAVAARGTVRACFANAGQLCVSIERAYVHEAVYEDYLAALVDETRQLRLGTGANWRYDVGSLTPRGHVDAIHTYVEDAAAAGATVHVGGEPRPDVGPNAYAPTVLDDVTDDMALHREETFGPLVAVHPVSSASDAVDLANDTDYGLNAVVFAGDSARGERVAARLDCGTVTVNDSYHASWASIDAPMGGMKDSGIGRRHGRDGLLKYVESQTIATQRGLPVVPDGVPANWWARGMQAALRVQKAVSRWRR